MPAGKATSKDEELLVAEKITKAIQKPEEDLTRPIQLQSGPVNQDNTLFEPFRMGVSKKGKGDLIPIKVGVIVIRVYDELFIKSCGSEIILGNIVPHEEDIIQPVKIGNSVGHDEDLLTPEKIRPSVKASQDLSLVQTYY